MGTNFYVRQIMTEKQKEKLHKLIDENKFNEIRLAIPVQVHIGKRSAGWRFCFNHNDWEWYSDVEDLKQFIQSNELYDEYGEEIEFDDFWNDIEAREKDPKMLDGDRYEERWDEIHPNTPKPDYMRRGYKGDEDHFGYRFSTSTDFS